MKNVKEEWIDEIIGLISEVQKYRILYNTTVDLFCCDCAIANAIVDNCKRVLNDIDDELTEIYKVWSGISELQLSDFDNDIEAYYDYIDDIDCKHEEVAGMARFLIAKDVVDIRFNYIPMDFIIELNNEYQIFNIINEEEVEIE